MIKLIANSEFNLTGCFNEKRLEKRGSCFLIPLSYEVLRLSIRLQRIVQKQWVFAGS